MKLWQQVIIGLVLGIIAGLVLKEKAAYLKVFGTIFISLIKMVVIPLIFFALLAGITAMGNSKNFKRVGLKSLFSFLMTAAFAVVIGIVAGTIFHPGAGVSLDLLNHGAASAATPPPVPPKISEMLIGLIPTNAMKAMVEDHILQVIIFAVFTGISLNLASDRCQKVIELVQEMSLLTFKMIEMVVKFAPLGVFGFISWTVGTQGLDVIVSLAKFAGTVIIACIFQYFVFGILILVFGRISPLPFYRKMLEPQTLAFSTSSSKATLTTAMRVLNERMGVSKHSTNFVLPLGASINMDGTAIYLGICALFFAQVTGTVLTGHDYMVLILTSTLASIGAAGIPSGSLIFMGMVLSSVGLPIEGIALIAGVDRILDMVRTTINITGDSAITLIIDSSEGHLDKTVYNS